MSDPDVCVFCLAPDCLNGAASHGIECPFITGMWPVDEDVVRRGTVCCVCSEPFMLGEFTAQIHDMTHPAVVGALPLAEAAGLNEDAISFTVCLPCAALGDEVPR